MFVTVQDFSIPRTNVVRALSIPPHHYVFPKDFNVGAFAKHVNKRFVRKEAAFTFWRSLYIHFVKRVISGYDVMN